jgi:hypothetical protein
MALFDLSDFETSAPQCLTHYYLREIDALDIVVHQSIRVSDVIVFDILDTDHLPIIFHIVDHVKFRNLPEPGKIHRLDRFQSLATELISPGIGINSEVEADKGTRLYRLYCFSIYV